ncbi:hypothetical protein ABQG55_07145 [Aeromonas dhakensis]|uniref:hypothetical protein n=1 Tax=Aeromonas TaxID=642 RepID=UPI000CC4C446|nr:hypothetical protein [Aeromonas hydrophila]PKD25730.1 hypothetical protein AO056_00805 [Aeromonas hydrophila]WRK93701.1 hypothetical protein U8518_08540 [Aeromonas hydrophila]HAT2713645.1 hypothetical protein [Aeromonas hydrophila]
MESTADIGQQLVTAATSAMQGGTGAVVGVGAVILGLTAAVKLLHVVKSALGR